jgi:hypothetical protein
VKFTIVTAKFTAPVGDAAKRCPVKPCLLCFTGVAPEDGTGAYLTGPINTSNPSNPITQVTVVPKTQLSEKETIQWPQATYHKVMTTMSRKFKH